MQNLLFSWFFGKYFTVTLTSRFYALRHFKVLLCNIYCRLTNLIYVLVILNCTRTNGAFRDVSYSYLWDQSYFCAWLILLQLQWRRGGNTRELESFASSTLSSALLCKAQTQLSLPESCLKKT